MEFLRKWQRNAVLISPDVVENQASKSAQLILGVSKALCDLECLRQRLAHLGSFGCRCAQRGVQPHFLSPVPGRSGSESAKRLLGAAAALLKQR